MKTKSELRAVLRKKRAALGDEEKKASDGQIVERIRSSPLFRDCDAILLYAPKKEEINLLPLLRAAQDAGKAVAFPVSDAQNSTMVFRVLSPGEKLVPGAFGIPEPPADAPLLTPTAHTLCLVPALTFDAEGNRLGYGRGFYDRYLASFPGVTAGAVRESHLSRRVPTEAHDVPVSYLFTERGVIPCARRRANAQTRAMVPAKPQAEEAPSFPRDYGNWDYDIPFPLRDRLRSSLRDWNERRLAKAGEKRKKILSALASAHRFLIGAGDSEIKPLWFPATLVLAVYLLLLFSRAIDRLLVGQVAESLGTVFLQLLVFGLPICAVLFLRREKLQGDTGYLSRLRIRFFRPEQLWLLFCLLVMMVTGSLLMSILTGGVASLGGNFTLYSTFVARFAGSPWRVVFVILAYAVFPAFLEEALFRVILCAEYERYGVPVAVTVSALFFAMLHFSLPLFPAYFLLGLLLALSLYVTRSALAPMILHLLYNLFCLFGQPYLSAFYVNAGSNEIFLFCLIVLCLLFSAFFAGEARKVYHLYARAGVPSDYTVTLPWKAVPVGILRAMAAPATLAAFVVYLLG